jgi:YVTN family beta-propeller protein
MVKDGPISKGCGKKKCSLSYLPRTSKCSSALLTAALIVVSAVSALAHNPDPALVATIKVGEEPNGLAVTPDGSEVYVANSGSNTVSVISSTTLGMVGTIAVGTKPMFVAITPDSTTAFVSNTGDDTVSEISIANKAVTHTLAVGKSPLGLAVTPDGTQLWVCDDAGVSVVDIAARAIIKTIKIPVGQRPVQIVFSSTAHKSDAFVLNQGDLAPTGTQVQGYVTKIGVAEYGIRREITFTQDNTVPLGLVVSQKNPEDLFVSCLGSEKEIVWIQYGFAQVLRIFSPPRSNPHGYLAGVAGGGEHFGDRYLFMADYGGNKLIRRREHLGLRASNHGYG